MTDYLLTNNSDLAKDAHPAEASPRSAALDLPRSGSQLLQYFKIAEDWIFRALVKCHPTPRLKKFRHNAKQIRYSGAFDDDWYRETYQIRPSQDPTHHFLLHGATLQFKPNPIFNMREYVKAHPDAVAEGRNPLLHLLSSGEKLKRVPTVAECSGIIDGLLEKCADGFRRMDPRKKTVLLVSHEISRTGAPILVWNLAKALRPDFNIVIVSLHDGALVGEYREVCDVLIYPETPIKYFRSEVFLTQLFEKIISKSPIAFAIANTVISYVALKPLWNVDVPSIHLIHDFASYARPIGAFLFSAFYASLPVFSAKVVEANAVEFCPQMEGRSILLPQGINAAPGIANSSEAAAEERKQIIETFRPEGFPKETVIVLGIGSICHRKGVDLFIACAKKVADRHPKTPFRFVWIGHGFDTDTNEYSMFLADQIQRSGLADVVTLAKEVSEIETAHQQSDIFLMSSRLDPLPQVSQDAMAYGKPVICFDGATGTAEYLETDAVAAFGVVPYFDIDEAANRIALLIDDEPRRQEMGEACRELAARYFCFKKYVARLKEIGLEFAAEKEKELEARETVWKSGLFRFDFFSQPNRQGSEDELLREYIAGKRFSHYVRKPFPGFHPEIYAERHPGIDGDPLVHYLKSGQPAGPWRYEVIESGETPEVPKGGRVGLHLHLFFEDVAADIFERIKKIQTPIDLLISVPSEEFARKIESAARQCARGKTEFRVVPNRGRDIGPFLTEFGAEILSQYDIIGHIHGKKSTHVDAVMSKEWTSFLYENLLGGKQQITDAILHRMACDETLGLVFPDDPNIVGWDQNKPHAEAMAERLGIGKSHLTDAFSFPVGTMFWAKPAALRPLFDLGLQWSDYPQEPIPQDGSMLHAIERLIPLVVEYAGFKFAVTNIQGLSR